MPPVLTLLIDAEEPVSAMTFAAAPSNLRDITPADRVWRIARRRAACPAQVPFRWPGTAAH